MYDATDEDISSSQSPPGKRPWRPKSDERPKGKDTLSASVRGFVLRNIAENESIVFSVPRNNVPCGHRRQFKKKVKNVKRH